MFLLSNENYLKSTILTFNLAVNLAVLFPVVPTVVFSVAEDEPPLADCDVSGRGECLRLVILLHHALTFLSKSS